MSRHGAQKGLCPHPKHTKAKKGHAEEKGRMSLRAEKLEKNLARLDF